MPPAVIPAVTPVAIPAVTPGAEGGERPVGVGSEVWAYEPVVTAGPKS